MFIVCLPLWKLLGGALPFALLGARGMTTGQTARCLYHAGLAALTLGSMMTGIFEIYGSISSLVVVYWGIGGVLIAAGIANFAWNALRPAHSPEDA